MLKRIFTIGLLSLFAACNSGNRSDDGGDTGNGIAAPQPITFSIDTVLPHDPQAYTQGLQFYNGKLYEGTGDYENSSLRIVDIKTGTPEKIYKMGSKEIFGEGITIFKNKIYQLTWQSKKIFIYNLNDIMHPIKTFSWTVGRAEGWGITNDGNNLIISDGSDTIYYALPDEEKNEMKIIKEIYVADNTGILDSINELEFIDGYIFANRYQTNDILKIDTANGHVVGKMDLTGLLAQYDAKEISNRTDVLNGIAYDSATKKLYITGKRWPKMFEVKLNK
ncbi:MAG: glutaminyl-peptide cyclotransferase [Chitinophagaceae bacterium]|nr:glutaminyl-peptide cyclotransferase [Chitinophagaceae bacterium]